MRAESPFSANWFNSAGGSGWPLIDRLQGQLEPAGRRSRSQAFPDPLENLILIALGVGLHEDGGRILARGIPECFPAVGDRERFSVARSRLLLSFSWAVASSGKIDLCSDSLPIC